MRSPLPHSPTFVVLFTICAALLASPLRATPDDLMDVNIDIPYQKFVLKNGLTLIVHEDRKAPIVGVNIWYHVGSKNEKAGKTGFAHLFEHLMFTGSEHFKGSGDQRAFFEAMENIGATDLNGTTDPDRTNFFENVPKDALDVALWIESDRMGHLLGSIDQARLDTQRGVVQNEKRQGENQPYGVTRELITKGTAPQGHPYSWTTIGSMEDLNAASLEDVKDWFKTYYGAANVVLVLAGDIDAETALQKAEHFFGDIPAGPPVARHERWIPHLPGTRRETVSDRVPQARVYKVWNIPPHGDPETVRLHLATDILANGKSSRLYKRLVYEEQIATDVGAYVWGGEISGLFGITATARPGGDLAKVEQIVDEEVARFVAKGPTSEELKRVKAQQVAAFVRGLQRIGAFGGKSDILAMNQTYRGSPDFYKTIWKMKREATASELQRAAQRWLTDDVYVLQVHPYPNYESAKNTVDRSRLPTPTAPTDAVFPTLQWTNLANGMKVILAERHSAPLISLDFQIDAGFAADQFALPGTAKLTMDMLNEGTAKRSSLEISEQLAALGATFNAAAHLDNCSVGMTTLTSTLDKALDIYADLVLHPTFPQADFQRRQKLAVATVQREKADPFSMALRVFPNILYGNEHAYGNPLTGSGTEQSVGKLTRNDLHKFHQAWFKPNNATLIVVGDTTLRELMPRLQKLFGHWKPGDVPKKNLQTVEHQEKSRIYLVDRPGSIQSMILAGHVAVPKANPDEISIETLQTILGGSFTSRLNMNLREDKHWSYGAGVFMMSALGQRPFIAYASVQSDKTKESMQEIEKELRGMLAQRPATDAELATAQKQQTLSLAGSWETLGAVQNSIGEIVRYDLPEDYFSTYPKKVRALQLSDLSKAANKVIHPDHLVWVVVGDREKIETSLRELGWGEITLLDADANPAETNRR